MIIHFKIFLFKILKFSNNTFETAEFCCIIDLTAISRLLQKTKSTLI